MNIYIHTLNGLAAAFDGRQVCYAWNRAPVAYSLKQIRQEQAASRKWRLSRGLMDDDDRYGYRLLKVEPPHER